MTPSTLPPWTFAIAQTFDTLDSGWRTFPGHYLLYAAQGAFRLDADNARWLLPPQRAAWVRAGTRIRLRTDGVVVCRSILFAPGTIPAPAAHCRVFGVTPMVREMIAHTLRWGMEREPDDPVAERFFVTLADVCAELAAQPDRFWLPCATSLELGRAIDLVLGDLSQAHSLSDVAHMIGVSERTLERRFMAEAQMTWRQFIGRARMIHAMELLAQSDLPVIEVAYSVGFETVSAFSTAFRRFADETPSQYRRRFGSSAVA